MGKSAKSVTPCISGQGGDKMEIYGGDKELQLKVDEINLNHLYDKYLLEDGEYKLKVLIGTPAV